MRIAKPQVEPYKVPDDYEPDMYETTLTELLVYPGAQVNFSGEKGSGKTHNSIAIVQSFVEHAFPTMKHTILLTNINFVTKRANGDIVDGFPPNVHHVTRLMDVFPIIADGIERYGRKNVVFVLMLDEAQGYLIGELNNTGKMAIYMKQLSGIVRKFNLCLWFLTPVLDSLSPQFRYFIRADHKHPANNGNVTAALRTDREAAKQYMRENGIKDVDYRSLVILKTDPNAGDDADPFLVVPQSSWTQDPETMKPGEYAYDTFAPAMFKIGEGFDFNDFVHHISKHSSYAIVHCIRDYYRTHINTANDIQDDVVIKNTEYERRIIAAYQSKIVTKMQEAGLTKKQIAYIFDISERSVGNRLADNRMMKKRSEKEQVNNEKTALPENRTARQAGKQQSEGAKIANIYYSYTTPPKESSGDSAVAFSSEEEGAEEEGVPEGRGSSSGEGGAGIPCTLVPDGRYDLGQLQVFKEYYKEGAIEGEGR